MLIAVCGKTNVGKTTFFSASTLVDAEISNRIFTTIQPNRGVTYVRTECACKSLKVKCSPNNSKCIDGTRFVPVKVIDVAGLVPDAHKGRGLGNQFLADAMEADGIINVIDISGSTDSEGNPTSGHNPEGDIEFFEKELDYWMLGILKKGLQQTAKRIETTKGKLSDAIYKQLSGLKISQLAVEEAIKEANFSIDSTDEQYLDFLKLLRSKSKPIIIAANKIDITGADRIYEKFRERVNPCSADTELALRKAAEKGIVDYKPGDNSFRTLKELDEKHKQALDRISLLLDTYGSTGVQNIINELVFQKLQMIVVYPVENEHKYTDKKGNVLPDALLLKRGSTAHDLAYAVHEDIGKKFIAAVDVKTGRNISATHELQHGDIISIKAGR